MLSGHGGVVIGSEMSGGVKGITISNCVFDGTDRGIRIKSMRGRGATVENVRVNNIVMRNIGQDAINVNMFYKKTDPEPLSERTPTFKNFHFSNITIENTHRAASILGLPENPASFITFNDINVVDADEGFILKDATNIEFHNVSINCKKGSSFSAENVMAVEFNNVKTFKPVGNVPLINLVNVQNAYISNCNPLYGTKMFLNVLGKSTSGIFIQYNNLSNLQPAINVGKEVDKNEVIIK